MIDLEPGQDCTLCPRLAAFREENRKKFHNFFNAPVPCFGSRDAKLLIVGLAPGLQGANRTGRPFTGDYAGDLLYATLLKHGLAAGAYDRDPGDGLTLVGCRIVNAVRCVPPQNKPTPAEIGTCNTFLRAEIAAMGNLKALLALGAIAHGAVLTALSERKSKHAFAHNVSHNLTSGLVLVDSYHCSRYNTNTGVLTTEMFEMAVITAKSTAA